MCVLFVLALFRNFRTGSRSYDVVFAFAVFVVFFTLELRHTRFAGWFFSDKCSTSVAHLRARLFVGGALRETPLPPPPITAVHLAHVKSLGALSKVTSRSEMNSKSPSSESLMRFEWF